MATSTKVSRRALLKGIALLGVGLSSKAALSQQKASKEALKYQDKPNGTMQCSNCAQFVAPDSCKILEGSVRPQGYCIAWVKK